MNMRFFYRELFVVAFLLGTGTGGGAHTFIPASGGVGSALATGGTTITATSDTLQGMATLTATSPVLTSIVVSPANPSLALGDTQPFTATGTYSDGSTQDISSAVTWTSSVPSVASLNAGLATGARGGTSTIMAASGSVSGLTTLTVLDPVLIEQINASSSVLVQENYDPLQVSGLAQKVVIGNPLTVTAVTVEFQNKFPNANALIGYAYVDIVKDDGTGKPSNQVADILGTSTNQASGVHGESFTFTMPAVAVPAGTFYVVVRTQNVSVNGYSAFLVVTGRTSAPGAMDPVQIQDPSSQNWSVATPQQFLTVTLTAVSAASPSLSSVTVTPATPAIAIGATQQFAAIGVYSDGTMEDLTNSVTWNSPNAAVTVNPSGLATGVGDGTSSIIASSGSTSASSTLTVGTPEAVQQTNSDSSILVQQDLGPLQVSGISQRLSVTSPMIINSVAVQFTNTFPKDGYAYVDIVKDDGTGKPSNTSSDILATSIDKAFDLQTGSYTFNFLPTVIPAGAFQIVLRTQNVGPISYSALTATTGSTSSLGGLDTILVQDPMTQTWSVSSPAQYLTFTLAAVTMVGPTTGTFINGKGYCQSIKAPAYYCLFMPTSVLAPDSQYYSDGGNLSFYVVLNPDGSFTNGQVWYYTAQGLLGFTATNWSGTNFNGTFSGTNPDGSTFSGSATESVSTCQHWEGGGRAPLQFVTQPCVTSGTGMVTVVPAQ